MNRLWKWLRPLPMQKTAEEELGLAILAIVDGYKLEAGQSFVGAVVGHVAADGRKLPAVHFCIEVCDQPEVCFGPTFAEGVSIQ